MNVELGRQDNVILFWKSRGRTVSFLGIHKLEPAISIGFSSALHLQCDCFYCCTEAKNIKSGLHLQIKFDLNTPKGLVLLCPSGLVWSLDIQNMPNLNIYLTDFCTFTVYHHIWFWAWAYLSGLFGPNHGRRNYKDTKP
jgi:hypothetical protein